MKELSVEEKAKRYDELKVTAQELEHDGCFDKITLFDLFPELKESEDERIRKHLIGVVELYYGNTDEQEKKDCLAWLEKRGKNNMGISEATKKKLEDNLNKALEKETSESWNKFLDEQKPADKVEPKFKVSDWITNGIDVDKIIGIDLEDENYLFENGGKSDISLVESISHIWTIQDAKDGDVLCCESGWTCIFKTLVNDETFSSYCFMDNTKWFCETGSECHTLNKEFMRVYNGEIKPATKEQRDTFEKAMADAGYIFDFEKKELKEIEQKHTPKHRVGDTIYYNSFGELKSMIVANVVTDSTDNPMYEDKEGNAVFEEDIIEQKSEWSKYDKLYLDRAIASCMHLGNIDTANWLKSLKDRVQPQPKQEWSEYDEYEIGNILSHLKACLNEYTYSRYEKYLKSLRPQKHWKPSDEQIEALDFAADCIVLAEFCVKRKVLKELLEQLKKLREE